jgi:hypothetical protein
MKSTMLIVIATLAAFGQKIETQNPDRNKITRLGTTQNHLSVIELGEPVTQVAAGSRSNPTPPPTFSSGPPPAGSVTS